MRSYNQKWDLAAHCSKANREASLVERKISFSLDAGNQREKQMLVQRPTLPSSNNQWARAFIERGRGLHAEIAQSAQTVSLKLVIGNLTSVFLIVLIDLIFSARVNLFQFLEASSAVVASYVMTAVWFSCS